LTDSKGQVLHSQTGSPQLPCWNSQPLLSRQSIRIPRSRCLSSDLSPRTLLHPYHQRLRRIEELTATTVHARPSLISFSVADGPLSLTDSGIANGQLPLFCLHPIKRFPGSSTTGKQSMGPRRSGACDIYISIISLVTTLVPKYRFPRAIRS